VVQFGERGCLRCVRQRHKKKYSGEGVTQRVAGYSGWEGEFGGLSEALLCGLYDRSTKRK